MNIYRIGKWCGIVLSAAGLGLVSGSVIGQTNLWHGYPRLSPFEEVRWTPQVKVGGTWYALVSVNGVSVEKMRDYCQSAGDSEHFWQKHFGEDMVEILSHVIVRRGRRWIWRSGICRAGNLHAEPGGDDGTEAGGDFEE